MKKFYTLLIYLFICSCHNQPVLNDTGNTGLVNSTKEVTSNTQSLLKNIVVTTSKNDIQKVTNHKHSIWEGLWEYKRYDTTFDGDLKITDCQNNWCNFEIGTSHGGHTCSIDGKFKTNAYQAEYKETLDSDYDAKEVVVTFQLNAEKNIINVSSNHLSYYCGVAGNFEGEYENINNPLRYDTGFDCWAKDLSDTEKVICASKRLANAHKEISEKYKSVQTENWYKKRATCKRDEKCLWRFYVNSIRSAYEKAEEKPLNLYEYMGNIPDNTFYDPTDFTLLEDYFYQNVSEEDYKEWTENFMLMGDDRCSQCYYSTYCQPGACPWHTSAFYISKDDIWLAFFHNDYDNREKEFIVIYALPDKTEKDIPSVFEEWLNGLKQQYSKNVKLKHFSKKITE